MVVVAVFFKGIKVVAMEVVTVLDVGVLRAVPIGVYKSLKYFQEKMNKMFRGFGFIQT